MIAERARRNLRETRADVSMERLPDHRFLLALATRLAACRHWEAGQEAVRCTAGDPLLSHDQEVELLGAQLGERLARAQFPTLESLLRLRAPRAGRGRRIRRSCAVLARGVPRLALSDTCLSLRMTMPCRRDRPEHVVELVDCDAPPGAIKSTALGTVLGRRCRCGSALCCGADAELEGLRVGAKLRAWSGLKPSWPVRTTVKPQPGRWCRVTTWAR